MENDGAVAQLGERLLCKQDVIGSIPVSSTKTLKGIDANLLEVESPHQRKLILEHVAEWSHLQLAPG